MSAPLIAQTRARSTRASRVRCSPTHPPPRRPQVSGKPPEPPSPGPRSSCRRHPYDAPNAKGSGMFVIATRDARDRHLPQQCRRPRHPRRPAPMLGPADLVGPHRTGCAVRRRRSGDHPRTRQTPCQRHLQRPAPEQIKAAQIRPPGPADERAVDNRYENHRRRSNRW